MFIASGVADDQIFQKQRYQPRLRGHLYQEHFERCAASGSEAFDLHQLSQNTADLAANPGNRLEKLRGDREGQYSIRINDQYRICFEWLDGDAINVEIVDYH